MIFYIFSDKSVKKKMATRKNIKKTARVVQPTGRKTEDYYASFSSSSDTDMTLLINQPAEQRYREVQKLYQKGKLEDDHGDKESEPETIKLDRSDVESQGDKESEPETIKLDGSDVESQEEEEEEEEQEVEAEAEVISLSSTDEALDPVILSFFSSESDNNDVWVKIISPKCVVYISKPQTIAPSDFYICRRRNRCLSKSWRSNSVWKKHATSKTR